MAILGLIVMLCATFSLGWICNDCRRIWKQDHDGQVGKHSSAGRFLD